MHDGTLMECVLRCLVARRGSYKDDMKKELLEIKDSLKLWEFEVFSIDPETYNNWFIDPTIKITFVDIIYIHSSQIQTVA